MKLYIINSIAGNIAALHRQYRHSVRRLISALFEKARYKSSGTKPLAQKSKADGSVGSPAQELAKVETDPLSYLC